MMHSYVSINDSITFLQIQNRTMDLGVWYLTWRMSVWNLHFPNIFKLSAELFFWYFRQQGMKHMRIYNSSCMASSYHLQRNTDVRLKDRYILIFVWMCVENWSLIQPKLLQLINIKMNVQQKRDLFMWEVMSNICVLRKDESYETQRSLNNF